MWLRLRFDIGWWDCLYAVLAAFSPAREISSSPLPCKLSSLFKLPICTAFSPYRYVPALIYFYALSLQGSVVLMSCVTIPDMVRIVEAHGLVARPVDLADDGSLSIDGLDRAFVAKSKVLVVVHLFGCRQDIGEMQLGPCTQCVSG